MLQTGSANSRGVDARIHAAVCTLVFLVCALLTRPYVEMGVGDDWSFIRTAQMMAQTGHVIYNGGTSPMLGWQIYFGALFIKLFGFPFTVVRASIVLLAAFSTYLLHRILSGFGLDSRMATLACLTVMLSPVSLLLGVTFMSDVPGLFCILLCLYACQRALFASSDLAVIAWLCFAGVSDIVGGTVRQIAWLGVLVVLPCSAWLLRRRRRVLPTAIALWLLGVLVILVSMHWFLRQPYALPEKLLPGPVNQQAILSLGFGLTGSLFESALLLAPILALFPFRLWDFKAAKRWVAFSFVGVVIVGLLIAAYMQHRTGPLTRLPPWLGTNLSPYGVMQAYEIAGKPMVILHQSFLFPLTIVLLICAASCVFYLCASDRINTEKYLMASCRLSWRQTYVLLIPFSLAYLALLAPRAMFQAVFDRYLIPLLIPAAVFLLRPIQQRITRASLLVAFSVFALFTYFSVASTHDLFAFDRARVVAADEVTASGVPRTAVDAGFEYDGWTEILTRGYVNDARIVIPEGAYQLARPPHTPCRNFFWAYVPSVTGEYVLTFDPSCFSSSAFPPVPYDTWLSPHGRKVYVQQAFH